MPIYEYNCKHGHHFERTLHHTDYKTPQTCECGAEGRRILSLPILKIPQDIRYDSPIDGRPITSEKKRREDLARSGCRPYDPEMKKDAERFRQREQDRLEAAVDATVEESIERMPSRDKERLANELVGGAEAVPVNGTPNLKPVTTQLAPSCIREQLNGK